MDKVTLYIATHNKTGFKYFGKTNRFFTEKDLQEKYHGSGLRWLRHLKKHGDDVTMEIYGIYNTKDVEKIAMNFSKDNDIANSNEWANIINENGLNGGSIAGPNHPARGIVRTKEQKEATSKVHKNKIVSKETRKKISESNKGRYGKLNNNYGTIWNEKQKDNLRVQKINTVVVRNKITNDCYSVQIEEWRNNPNLEAESKGRKIKDTSNYGKPGELNGMFGKSHSEKTKEKMRKSKGPQVKLTCPYCNKEGGISNMKRYHFENCKLKGK